MLIKKIDIKNFRQFVGKQTIVFSQDLEKNITLIMGDNGSGKTTLAQAFHWVLFGENAFKDKHLLSSEIQMQLTSDHTAETTVDLYLEYNEKQYTISRKVVYTKASRGLSSKENLFRVYEIIDGNQKPMPERSSQRFVQEMLPRELSQFFIFDGERIKDLSDEIDNRRSNQFREAVRGLVGLTPMQNAIKHFKPSNSKSTIIGRFNKEIDAQSNEKVNGLTARIEELDHNIQKKENALEEIKNNKKRYEDLEKSCVGKLRDLMPIVHKKEEYDSAQKDLLKHEKKQLGLIEQLLQNFNHGALSYFLTPLSKKIDCELKMTKSSDKALPDIQQRTVQILLDRGFCICGTPLKKGSPEEKNLLELMNYLPPQSIGTQIRQFTTESNNAIRNSNVFYNQMVQGVDNLENEKDSASQCQTTIDDLVNLINGADEGKTAQKQYDECKEQLKKLDENENRLLSEKGSIESRKRSLENQREELVHIGQNSEIFIKYRAYAKAVYEKLTLIYDLHETKTRKKLEETINQFFEDIYGGGMKIHVDNNYQLTVEVFEEEQEQTGTALERSTAQNYSIIFAFISGIIKLAKGKRDKDKNEEEDEANYYLDDAQGYPLIMDAPLSAFDKKRINNVCQTLPDIAQQVVFFIKDTDGDVAAEHMANRIGASYVLEKSSNTKSFIKEVQYV
ncbi:MAG: AAA family ATPase [Eubacteriaceae bacterium]|nr:AAA family ATPase [Eubacteriaceae bacterium]